MQQRYWEDIELGEQIKAHEFPLTIYRMVMVAGANRDFNAIHHNAAYARSTGAPDIYANTLFLQGMWERAIRDFIGLAGTIRQLRGFRMKSFSTVGDTVYVKGRVVGKSCDGITGLVEIEVWSENGTGVSVGPGTAVVTVPRRA